MTQTMLCTRKNLIITHDLQLDHFAVQLHGPDFLQYTAPNGSRSLFIQTFLQPQVVGGGRLTKSTPIVEM